MLQEASLFMAGPVCAAWQFPEPVGCKARGGFFPGMLEGGSLTAVCWGATFASAEPPKRRWTSFCPECHGEQLCPGPLPQRGCVCERSRGSHVAPLLVSEPGFCRRRFR